MATARLRRHRPSRAAAASAATPSSRPRWPARSGSAMYASYPAREPKETMCTSASPSAVRRRRSSRPPCRSSMGSTAASYRWNALHALARDVGQHDQGQSGLRARTATVGMIRPCAASQWLTDAASGQSAQSTATARAAQTCRIRASASRPSRSTSTATETLSTESRLTTQRRGTGSSPGFRPTSLTRPRIVVVHGAISARRCRGITASRESTTTGRRPISGSSHHHTSPRAGRAFTTARRLPGMTPGRPTRPAR
jgi:hypothetical protein